MVTAEMTQLAGLFRRMTGDEKHEWAAASTLDVLWVLYDRVLNVSPDRTADPERDRFLLSKGHGPMAYYAVLAAKGFIDESILDQWTELGSPLGQHPDRTLVDGVEISSGSLGHGLAIGAGVALGLRAQARRTSSLGWPGGIARRFGVEGWRTATVDGRDHEALYHALTAEPNGMPTAVVATVGSDE
jgi:transketolase